MHPSCPFVVKDLNEDGRLDILFGRGHNYGLYWREQLDPKPDGTTRWRQHVIDESWSQAHALELADLDGDGREELIAGKCIWAHNAGDPGAADPPAVYYYKWDRSARSFTRHTIAAPGEGIALGRQYSVTDLNGDGMEESISGSRPEKQARPTITSYMYGNARAICEIAKLAGKLELAREFDQKAATLRKLTLEKLWN